MATNNKKSGAEPIPKSQRILNVSVTMANAQHVK
jgi:hypothetical protein